MTTRYDNHQQRHQQQQQQRSSVPVFNFDGPGPGPKQLVGGSMRTKTSTSTGTVRTTTETVSDTTAEANGSYSSYSNESSLVMSSWPDPQRQDTPLLGEDEFVQWVSHWAVLTWCFLAQFAAVTLFSFIVSLLSSTYPGPGTDNNHVWIFALAVGGVMILNNLMFARITGAFVNLWLIWLVVFVNMFFGRQFVGVYKGWRSRLSVIGKGIVLTIATLVGNFVGPLFTVALQGGKVMTSDCGTDFQILCLALPQTTFINNYQAGWRDGTGVLVIMMGTFIAWTVVKKRVLWVQMLTKSRASEYSGAPNATMTTTTTTTSGLGFTSTNSTVDEYDTIEMNDYAGGGNNNNESSFAAPEEPTFVPWEINDDLVSMSLVIGAAYFLVAEFNYGFVGGASDILYWLALSTYVGDRSQSMIYTWEGLVAGVVVFLGVLCYQALVYSASRRRSKIYSESVNAYVHLE